MGAMMLPLPTHGMPFQNASPDEADMDGTPHDPR
jgi:hypothetical protein